MSRKSEIEESYSLSVWGFDQDHKKLSWTVGKYEKNYIGILTYKSMSHEQNAEQSHNIKVAYK